MSDLWTIATTRLASALLRTTAPPTREHTGSTKRWALSAARSAAALRACVRMSMPRRSACDVVKCALVQLTRTESLPLRRRILAHSSHRSPLGLLASPRGCPVRRKRTTASCPALTAALSHTMCTAHDGRSACKA
eukprot:10916796-Alexandrium_andersonii.AAC.1